MRLAHFELHVTAEDPGEERDRWNSGPMASAEASETLYAAQRAFRAVLEARGFKIARVGYGVTASEVED